MCKNQLNIYENIKFENNKLSFWGSNCITASDGKFVSSDTIRKFNLSIENDKVVIDTRETIDDFVDDFSSLLTKEQAINEYNRLRKLHPDCSIDDLSNFLWEEILDKGGRDELK